MNESLLVLMKLSLVLYIVGSLLGMGLALKFHDAFGGLRNLRFVAQTLLWSFILCPALAWLLTRVFPLDPSYALGLVLLGMTPSSPFLPMLVEKARGDMGYAAAFMLLTSVVMIMYMPIAVPLTGHGLTVDAWTIARPLLVFVVAPLATGMAIHRGSEAVAARLLPFVKQATGAATIVMLATCAAVYRRDFLGIVGSYALATQVVFFSVAAAAPYWLSFGLKQPQKSVLALGLTMRNLGAALAPLFSIPDVDPRSIIMVVLAVPMQLIFGLLAARWFARGSPGVS